MRLALGGGLTPPFPADRQVKPGHSLRLVGNRPFLGNWDMDAALELANKGRDNWTATVELPAGGAAPIEFKVGKCPTGAPKVVCLPCGAVRGV